MIKLYHTVIIYCLVCVCVWNLVSHLKGKHRRRLSKNKELMTKNRRMEKIA